MLTFLVDGFDCLKGFSRGDFPDGQAVVVLMRNQFPVGTSLHLAGLQPHSSVFLRKFAVLWALVGSV